MRIAVSVMATRLGVKVDGATSKCRPGSRPGRGMQPHLNAFPSLLCKRMCLMVSAACLWLSGVRKPTSLLCLVRALQQAHCMWRGIHVKLHPASNKLCQICIPDSSHSLIHCLITVVQQHVLLLHVAATCSVLHNNIAVPVVFAIPKTFNTPCSLLQTKTATLLTHSPPPPHHPRTCL